MTVRKDLRRRAPADAKPSRLLLRPMQPKKPARGARYDLAGGVQQIAGPSRTLQLPIAPPGSLRLARRCCRPPALLFPPKPRPLIVRWRASFRSVGLCVDE